MNIIIAITAYMHINAAVIHLFVLGCVCFKGSLYDISLIPKLGVY